MKIYIKIILLTFFITSNLLSNDSKITNELITTIKNNNLKKLKKLVENDAELNATNRYGETLLHIAARNGKEKIVAYLADQNIDVNIKNSSNTTALHEACSKGNYISAEYNSTS